MLCLDFDGVICNSIDECLLVSYNSYMKIENRFENQVDKHSLISEKTTKLFYKYRYFVRPAKDYWVLINLIMNGRVEIDQEDFIFEKANNKKKLDEFEKTFFATRKELKDNNFDYWISLNRIYDDFIKAWAKLQQKYQIYIVTNKNKDAVETILKYYNIEIPNNHLFTKELFNSKLNALIKIARLNKTAFKKIIFIDDSPDTILETIEKFPKSYLANWGYYKNIEGIQSIDSPLELT